ncbi:MAG: hypothetical protein EBU01_17155, partial [Crocinitomicaceae bacterium]|nr:hypothetical protein [Crocinitomicaceae bacterium]
MKKILYITFLSYLLLNSCSDNSIQNGDTIFIEFKIINNKKERIDENSLCNGKKLLLKVVLGENFLPKIIEKKIIGKVYGETIRMSINSTDL